MRQGVSSTPLHCKLTFAMSEKRGGAVNHEQKRNEIRSTLLRAQRTMMKQSERMQALSEGRPDPYPEMDAEFVNSMIGEHSEERSEAP